MSQKVKLQKVQVETIFEWTRTFVASSVEFKIEAQHIFTMRASIGVLLAACLCSCALAQSWGSTAWTYEGSAGVESTVTVSADKSTIYYNTYDGVAVAASARDGSIQWYNDQMGEMIRSTSLLVQLNSSLTALYLIAGDAQLCTFFIVSFLVIAFAPFRTCNIQRSVH
jgi:hypothetical protein